MLGSHPVDRQTPVKILPCPNFVCGRYLFDISNTVLFTRGTDGDGNDRSHNNDTDDGSADNTKQKHYAT